MPGCQGASVPQRRARPELPLWCFRPHAWGRVGGAEVFLSIYTYIDTHIYVFMVQTSELTRPTLTHPPNFPSTLKKKLRLSGDFFRDLNIYISTLVFFFPPLFGGLLFSLVFKTLSLYITIMERKFIVSFHKGVVLNSI